jgi:hypothetical protein
VQRLVVRKQRLDCGLGRTGIDCGLEYLETSPEQVQFAVRPRIAVDVTPGTAITACAPVNLIDCVADGLPLAELFLGLLERAKDRA